MPFRESGSTSNHYWSTNLGPVHVIALSSYESTARDSAQFAWLLADLEATDRTATPWVVVTFHVPWYNSNYNHRAEGELMRAHLEELLFDYGVSLVLSGHVHAYERNTPVFDGCPNACGPHYLNLGDGGN